MTIPSKATIAKMLSAAKQAAAHAHAPYSQFHVGAAVYANGKIYAGCNVENAAYPLGQCAEATAIGSMVTSGNKSIDAIVILSPNDDFCYPCGGCRQKIVEFARSDTSVIMINASGEQDFMTAAELLPNTFVLDK